MDIDALAFSPKKIRKSGCANKDVRSMRDVIPKSTTKDFKRNGRKLFKVFFAESRGVIADIKLPVNII